MGSHPLFHESDPAPLFESSFDPLFNLKASFGTNTFFDDFCECVIWSVYSPCAMIWIVIGLKSSQFLLNLISDCEVWGILLKHTEPHCSFQQHTPWKNLNLNIVCYSFPKIYNILEWDKMRQLIVQIYHVLWLIARNLYFCEKVAVCILTLIKLLKFIKFR